MRVFIIIVFIFFSAVISAQRISERSRYEKRWAFFHPFAAIKAKKIYKICLPFYEELKKSKGLDAFENGGKLDAFRHTFFMAAFSQKIKTKKVRKLGIAREKGNHSNFLKNIKEEGELADSLSSVMDLKNNELGLKIGSNNRKTDINNLLLISIEELNKGEAVYFKRNAAGHYLTCEGQIIILENYKGKWVVPKCLMKTNE